MRESERKRLVELLTNGETAFAQYMCELTDKAIIGDVVERIAKRFEFYADHLLDNGIVVPPYEIGTKVFATIGSLSLPIPYAVYEVTIQRYVLATGGLVPVVKLKKGAVTYGEIHTSLDRLYTTREEALAKLGGGEG